MTSELERSLSTLDGSRRVRTRDLDGPDAPLSLARYLAAEMTRAIEALPAEDQKRHPAEDRDRQEDLRECNRELQAAGHTAERDGAGVLEPAAVVDPVAGVVQREGVGHA